MCRSFHLVRKLAPYRYACGMGKWAVFGVRISYINTSIWTGKHRRLGRGSWREKLNSLGQSDRRYVRCRTAASKPVTLKRTATAVCILGWNQTWSVVAQGPGETVKCPQEAGRHSVSSLAQRVTSLCISISSANEKLGHKSAWRLIPG